MARITSPVMRTLGAGKDTPAFYRDVLGFELRNSLAVNGPAHITFGEQDHAPLEWDSPRPAGSAMLFFETDDIAAMHDSIVHRGGRPSSIEDVNWIKMRMFSVHDPDGRVVWFGQSYNEPGQSRRAGLLEQALPELPFNDVAAGVRYYVNVLGFRINYQQDDLGVMERDQITILLIQRTGAHKGIGSFEVYVADADALYGELCAKGANVQGEPVSHQWGLRDFRVLDLEGNRITFAQPFE